MFGKRKGTPIKRSLNPLIGVLFCACGATIASFLFHSSAALQSIVPLAFLGIVTCVALRYGMAAGVIGSLVSAVIFSIFLFRPHGSIVVASTAARTSVAWLLLGGLALSALFAPRHLGNGRNE